MRGKRKILAKNEQWIENAEVHNTSVEGPYPHGDKFAVRYHFDVTPRNGPGAGRRMNMDEVGVYTVRNGKIAREEFFYSMD